MFASFVALSSTIDIPCASKPHGCPCLTRGCQVSEGEGVSLASCVSAGSELLRRCSKPAPGGQPAEDRKAILVVITCLQTVDQNPSSPNGVPLEGAFTAAAATRGGSMGAAIFVCLPEAGPSDALARAVGPRGVFLQMEAQPPKGRKTRWEELLTEVEEVADASRKPRHMPSPSQLRRMGLGRIAEDITSLSVRERGRVVPRVFGGMHLVAEELGLLLPTQPCDYARSPQRGGPNDPPLAERGRESRKPHHRPASPSEGRRSASPTYGGRRSASPSADVTKAWRCRVSSSMSFYSSEESRDVSPVSMAPQSEVVAEAIVHPVRSLRLL